VLAVVVLGVLAASNPGSRRDAEPESVESLGAVVAQYRSGNHDSAVAAVGLWSRGEVESQAESLLRGLESAARAGTPSPIQREETLRATVALLSEAALRALRQADPPRARWELAAAVRLVQAMRPADDAAGFSSRFYVAAGLMLHFMGDLSGAYEMLADGRRRAGEDAELLLGLGAVIETAASLRTYDLPETPRRQREAPDERRFVIEGEQGAGGRLPPTTLADAQAALAKALRRDPGLVEARLRLGRVLLLRGKPREALFELERVGRESSDARQRYLASLFGGRCHERLGDLRGAAGAYATAVERAPRAQSALVALARTLDALGEGARAQEAFGVALQAAGEPDPWLEYTKGRPDRIDTLVGELQRLVR